LSLPNFAFFAPFAVNYPVPNPQFLPRRRPTIEGNQPIGFL
jgi:hypothetical protein